MHNFGETSVKDMWTGYIKKTINSFQKDGAKCTINKIWCSLNPFLYRKAIMYSKWLAEPVLSNDVNVKIATEEDINEDYKDIWYTNKQAVEKLRKGHILFLWNDRNVNIFYGWVELLTINIPWLGIKKLHISSNIGYISKFYVPPQYRGRFLAKRALKFIEKYLLTNTHVDRVFCVTSPDNISSNRMFTLSGYSPYQHVKYFKIVIAKFYIVSYLGNRNRRINKIFIQSFSFWNAFSSILKRN